MTRQEGHLDGAGCDCLETRPQAFRSIRSTRRHGMSKKPTKRGDVRCNELAISETNSSIRQTAVTPVSPKTSGSDSTQATRCSSVPPGVQCTGSEVSEVWTRSV